MKCQLCVLKGSSPVKVGIREFTLFFLVAQDAHFALMETQRRQAAEVPKMLLSGTSFFEAHVRGA